MDIGKVLRDVAGGHRLSEEEAVALLKVRGRDIFEILSAADIIREERAGPVVTYVRNQNIHITNICKNLCGFCGFGRKEGDEGAFCDDREMILKKVALASSRNVTEICLLSGVHPGFTMETYEDILSTVHGEAPRVHIHAFSPDEVMHAARQSGIPTREVLERMNSAGLGASGREDLLLVAVSRLYLDNFRNIQVSWGKLGIKLGQLALLSGANDLAGTMFSDDVSGTAGAADEDYLDPMTMDVIVRDIGRLLRQR